MLPRLFDLLEFLVLLELLAVEQLQHAVYLDEVDAALQHELILLIFLVEFVYFSELLDEEGAALDVVVGPAVEEEDLLLGLEVRLALLVALLEQLLAVLEVALEVGNLLVEHALLPQLLQLLAADIVEVGLEMRALEVGAGAGGEEEELVRHVVGADLVDLEELLVDRLVAVEVLRVYAVLADVLDTLYVV